MSGLPLIKHFERNIQSIPSMIAVITLYWILKLMHVELLPYLLLKGPLTMTLSMYCMIHQNDSIHFQDSVTGPIKLGLGKLMFTTMRPEAWLVLVSWNA